MQHQIMCYTCFINRASFRHCFTCDALFWGLCTEEPNFAIQCCSQCDVIFNALLFLPRFWGYVLNAGAMKHPRTNKTKAALDTTPPDQQNKPHLKKVICIFLWVKGVYLETIKTFLFIQEISLAYENCMVIACILICLQSSRRLKFRERIV